MDAQIALQQTRQHFRHLGLTVPPAIEKELDKIGAILDRIKSATYEPDALTPAAWDALAAGRDVLTDERVTAALMAGVLEQRNLGGRLRAHADGLRAAVVTRHADELLAAMSDTVVAAGADLAEAHEKIRGLDITNPGTVTTLPTDHASVWARARKAAENLDRVGQVWTYIVQGCRLAPVQPTDRQRALIVAEFDAAELDALPIGTGAPWSTAVAHSGQPLAYAATPAEFMERLKRVEQQRAEQRQEGERGEAGGPVLARIRAGGVTTYPAN